MMLDRWVSKGIFILVTALSVSACVERTHSGGKQAEALNEGNAMTNEVVIRLGESGPDFTKRYPNLVRKQHQPAGIDFYSIDWNSLPRGVVRLDHGAHSFNVEDVLGVQGVQELGALEGEGMNGFSIFAGVTPPEFIDHDEARLKTHAILRRILDAGWRPFLNPSRPRLSGQARLDYVLNVTNSIGLDARLVPTLEEWMNIPSITRWPLYADGLFMEIYFQRQPNPADPDKSGAYLLTYDIKTEAEHYRGYVESEDRLRWKELLPAKMKRVAQVRATKETELRAQGIPIDETYRDPPLPPLDE